MRGVIVDGLLIVGAAFMLLASLGVLRMPDIYMRMSTTSKAASLGAGLILGALAVYFSDLGTTMRALAAIAFLLLTAPIAAHVLGRAACFLGAQLWEGTVADELRGRYHSRTHALASGLDEEPSEDEMRPS